MTKIYSKKLSNILNSDKIRCKWDLIKLQMAKSQVNQALQLVGNQHRYQWILILLISISWIALNFVLLGSTFVYMDPVFHCNGDFENKVFQKEACPQIQHCQLVQKFTLTAELQLYCDKQWARNTIQSIFNVGSLVGLFVMNLVSDTRSRKVALQISISLTALGLCIALIGGWKSSITTIIVAQFLQGFGSSSILPLSYAFLSDYCSDKFKPRAVIIVNTAWSLSTVLLGIFYLTNVNWSMYLILFTMTPLVITFILFQIFLIESPHILMLQNKRQQAIKVLEKLAKINKMEKNIPQINEIINQQNQKDEKTQASIKNVLKLLKQWEYLKPIIILSIIRIMGCLNFYGTSYAFGVEGLGLGYNSMIAGFMEIISYLGLTIFINRIPRRKGIAGFYSIVIVIGMMFWFDFVRKNMTLGTMLMGTSRIFSTVSYTLIASVQTQAFTNEIQSTAVAITQAFALLGAICAPLIVDLGDKIGLDPVVLISILVNFAVWPNYFLKQTLQPRKKNDMDPLNEQQVYRESLLSNEQVKVAIENPQSQNIEKTQQQ